MNKRLLALPLALATLSLPVAAQTMTTVRVANGLSSPLYVTSPPNDARLFIVEQGGVIKILSGGSVLGTPFLDISGSVLNGGPSGESGLLGLAFDPDYATNGRFYVNYSASGSNDTVVSQFVVSAGDPNVANAASETVLFTRVQPFSNHNGGCLQIGPDGMLYIAMGDGGDANDPGCRAQNPMNPLGKILRLDPDLPAPHIPSDNPFFGMAGFNDAVYHMGLRNPWRFSFDRVTGDMYIGDVGQDAREEIDFAPSGVGGLNYGWKVMEGLLCNSSAGCMGQAPACNDPAFTNPIQTYNHTGVFGGPCSVTGGYVYRGCAMPSNQGRYFYADFCTAQIWTFDYDGVSVTNFTERTAELEPPGAPTINSINSFGEDAFGEMYIVDGGGEVFKIIPAAPVAGTDCDSNGQIDSCEIALASFKDLDLDGGLDVCQEFSADTGEVSLSGGGEQNMAVHFGAGQGGNLFWINGSVTGTAPPLMVAPGLDLPLVFDSYTFLTATKPNKAPLNPSLGFMDAGGDGSGRFTVPPGSDPTLAGVTLYHAAGSLDLAFEFLATSNPITLELVP